MKRFLVLATALVAFTAGGCSDDPALLNAIQQFGNGASAASSTSHWQSMGTSSVALKISFYEDGTCEIQVSTPLYDSTNLLREGFYDCTFLPAGINSIILLVDGELGSVTVTLSDIEINTETGSWTVTVDYDDEGSTPPTELTMVLEDGCNMTNTNTTGTGCSD